MNSSIAAKPADPLQIEKSVTRFTLKAGLFWNNGPIVEGTVTQDGIFYWHNALSSGEKFLGFSDPSGFCCGMAAGGIGSQSAKMRWSFMPTISSKRGCQSKVS